MELLLRIYTLVNKILAFLLTPIFYLVFEAFGKDKKIPPLKNRNLEICAVDLAEKIRNCEVNIHFKLLLNVNDAITVIFTLKFIITRERFLSAT